MKKVIKTLLQYIAVIVVSADCSGAPVVCGGFLFHPQRFHGTCHRTGGFHPGR